MKKLNLIAMDYGASNGRAVLGQFDGNKIEMTEIHRFANDFVRVNGVLYWDTFDLYKQIVLSLRKFSSKFGRKLDGIGVDTWGVDYGLIDKNGHICGNPISYRYSNDETMKKLWENVIGKRELFDRTGLAMNNFNTIFQLYARKLRGDVALESADKLLLLPDLFLYMLSGEMGSEYTMAMTTQLCDPKTKDWDYELIDMIGVSRDIFLPISNSGSIRGSMLQDVCDDCNIDSTRVIAVAGHDTGSAVASVPGGKNSAFLSSGTWSLFGMESDDAIINDSVFESNYSNEGTAQGGFRPLKNIMGLWIIQQLRREWIAEGNNISWNDIVAEAKRAEPFNSLIDPDDGSFFSTDKMADAIREYCKKTEQPQPDSVSSLARCVYDSLALKYRWALEKLEGIKGSRIESLNIVGGGCQNEMLNQMTANALQRPVIAGPIEGASIGNLLLQAMALGEIADINELRQVVRNSFDVVEFEPKDASIWQDAYEKFLRVTAIVDIK